MTDGKQDIIALLDQTQAGLESVAELVANYYKSLLEKGVPETLAVDLAKDCQRFLLGGKQ